MNPATGYATLAVALLLKGALHRPNARRVGVPVLVCALAAYVSAWAEQPQSTSQIVSPTETATTPGASWLGEAQDELAQREYHASVNEFGLQAPNRAQGFRTYFNVQGIRLVSRSADSETLAAIEFIGYGRQSRAPRENGSIEDIPALGLADVGSAASEVTLDWPQVSARYDNGPDGLQQTITLEQRLSGSGPAEIVLAVTDAQPQLTESEILLHNETTPLRLHSFAARDAHGRQLDVALALVGADLRITIDDTQANYPITVQSVLDGVVNGLLESNQQGAQLGSSVGGAGDVNGDGYADVIIGSPFYDNGQDAEGAAFVYFGGAGAFNTIADAQLESNQAAANLGHSVAGAGDVNSDGYADVIVGADAYDNGQDGEGAAFIYFGGAGAFNTSADAQLESNQVSAYLGYSVAGAGDVNGDGHADVIVGAWAYDNGQNAEGAAFIYFGGPGAFNLTPDALLESDQPDAFMGRSAAGAGDVNGDGYADVIVGAWAYDNGQNAEGAAFIYFGGAGAFNLTPDALLESNQPDAYLGYGVAGAGDVNGDGYADVIVGAYEYDNGQDSEGAAFVYFGGAGAFNTSADGQLESNQVNAKLGYSVGGAGDVNGDNFADVIVGAYAYDNGQDAEGAAFVYFGGAGVFNTAADAQLESNQVSAWMGYSVAGAGDVNGDGYADVIVGAHLFNNGQDAEGAAFVHFGGAWAFNTSADGQIESNQESASLGVSVAGAGDVNGDGYADVIVGAYRYDNGQDAEGAAFIYFGSAGAFGTTADAQLESNQESASMGYSVAGAGDVNGDGYADVIVGSYHYDNGHDNEGAAFVYFGGAGAFNTSADGQLESNQMNANLGISVAGAGDVNGDGYADVIVGAQAYDNGQNAEGAAFVYFGGAGAFNTSADGQLESNQVGATLGISVAGAGDVNGDGYADVIVGAYQYDNGQDAEGAAFVYFGGAGAFNTSADGQLQSDQVTAFLGYSVAGAGDVNGDGYSDVIVGAYNFDNGQDEEGAAFVYFGGAGAFNTSADGQLESNQVNASLGVSVAGAGDVNGDGYADVIVAASEYDNGQDAEGAAFLYLGGAGAFNTSADAQFESNQPSAYLGSVAGAGDVNGDGYADLIVGAEYYSGQSGAGAAFVYFGDAGVFNLTHDARLESGQVSANLGYSVAGAGDVNGDGYADVVVGAPFFDNGQNDEGAAFVYFGGVGAFNTTADALLESNQADANLGYSVAGAGDVNGDGYADVIVGAWEYDNGQSDEGAAFIYFGGAGAFNTSADAQLESNQGNAVMGVGVAGAGDVNGDGYADVIVGAFVYDNGQSNEGAAFVYFGGAGAFNTTADAQLESDQANAFMGYSVAGAGDVNADGYADVIVGAYGYGNGQAAEGAAFLYFGGTGAFNTTADAQLESNQPNAEMGNSVAGAGDVNRDGYADVIVGAYEYDNGQNAEGAAFIYFGGGGPFNLTPDALLQSNQVGASMGYRVGAAGDVNGDGYADVIIGAYRYDNGHDNEGAAFIYFGGTGAFNLSPDARLESNQASANLGQSVAGAGDVNGDGYADVIVGAPAYNNGQDDEGAAFIYFGGGNGRLVQAGQYRAGGANPVQPWGLSHQSDGFTVKLNATSPRGRERARLQIEACPHGVPFGSVLCDPNTAANWTEIAANPQGNTLSVTSIGLPINHLYRWRARVQYAPLTITSPGITSPPNPTAGPWRRLQANGDVADIRTSPSEIIFVNSFE